MSQEVIFASLNKNQHPDIKNFYLHTHSHYELYCFLAGDVDFLVEGTTYPLEAGDLMIIGRSEAHYTRLHSPAPYERIVIHFSPQNILGTPEETAHIRKLLDGRPLGKGNRFPGATQKNPHWVQYLHKLINASGWARSVYLTTLLHELAAAYAELPEGSSGKAGGISGIIRYINENLTQPLSLELLSQEFFISKAQLNRSFKKTTGSTVWEYIQAKRLLLAKELLRTGNPPTQVGIQCGFGNYSGFYRAYKKRFGCAPNEEKVRR